MANEFERINNPDSLPGAVSTGYQLQNTNLISQRVGLDCSVVTGGTGECVLEVSGPVDVNGEIYTCNAQVTFTLTTAGKYYIHLAGTGANLTPTIGTGANTFDADKNARYTDTGTYRVLNWVIYYDGTTAYAHRLTNPVNSDNDYGDVGSPEEYWITADGVWVAKRSKYYTIYVTGTGQNPSGSTNNNGGGAGASGIKRIYVNSGTTWTATFTTTSGGVTTFTDGTTTFISGNGTGAVGGTCSGFDLNIHGGDGSLAINSIPVGGSGGSSFWGGGGYGAVVATADAGDGKAFGSGGGGKVLGGSGSAGIGKKGVIRIVG